MLRIARNKPQILGQKTGLSRPEKTRGERWAGAAGSFGQKTAPPPHPPPYHNINTEKSHDTHSSISVSERCWCCCRHRFFKGTRRLKKGSAPHCPQQTTNSRTKNRPEQARENTQNQFQRNVLRGRRGRRWDLHPFILSTPPKKRGRRGSAQRIK